MGVRKEAAFDEDAWDFGLADDGEVAIFDVGWFSGGAVQGLVRETLRLQDRRQGRYGNTKYTAPALASLPEFYCS